MFILKRCNIINYSSDRMTYYEYLNCLLEDSDISMEDHFQIVLWNIRYDALKEHDDLDSAKLNRV